MSFVESTLMQGEEIKFRTTLSKQLTIAGVILWGIIGLIFIKVIVASIFFWAIAVVGWVNYKTSEFAVTNRRVIIKTGVLKRRSLELLLTKLESIKFDQGFIESSFGLGKITVVGSGGTQESFKNIEQPLEFRKHIQEQIEALHNAKNI